MSDEDKDKLDLSFLDDPESIEPGKKLLFLCEELRDKTSKLVNDMKRQDENLFKEINRKLATGKCYIEDKEDGVLMYKEDEDSKPDPIWFPKGNALEWQHERGLVSDNYFNTMKDIGKKVEELQKREDNDEDSSDTNPSGS